MEQVLKVLHHRLIRKLKVLNLRYLHVILLVCGFLSLSSHTEQDFSSHIEQDFILHFRPLYFTINRNNFPFDLVFRPNQTPGGGKKSSYRYHVRKKEFIYCYYNILQYFYNK